MAMKSITWPQDPVCPATPRPLTDAETGQGGELLLETNAFVLERYTVGNSISQPNPGEMTIWMVLEGAAILDGANYAPHQLLERGSTVVLPAGLRDACWASADAKAPCRLLCIRLPVQAK
jgi:mannose-6-phosphate isomerase class I